MNSSSLKGQSFRKVGRILLYIFLGIFIVLPLIALPFIIWGCSGESEFCGLIFPVLFPWAWFFMDPDFFSFPLFFFIYIIGGSAVFLFLLRWLLIRYAKFDFGYAWLAVFLVILSLVTAVSLDKILYKYPSTDWAAWAEEAIKMNDPALCNNLEQDYQYQCFTEGALHTGNPLFCDNHLEEYGKINCLSQIQIVKNFSQKSCGSDYDLSCFSNACGSDCSMQVSNRLIDMYVTDKAKAENDLSWCDLFQGTPETDEQMYHCYTAVFRDQIDKTLDTTWCDKIDFDYDWSENEKGTCYDQYYLKMAENTGDSTWCKKITTNEYYLEDCNSLIPN